MKILSMEKDKEIVVSLLPEEVVKICNSFYHENNKSNAQLQSEMIIASNLIQYGHLDWFCIDVVSNCKKKGEL